MALKNRYGHGNETTRMARALEQHRHGFRLRQSC